MMDNTKALLQLSVWSLLTVMSFEEVSVEFTLPATRHYSISNGSQPLRYIMMILTKPLNHVSDASKELLLFFFWVCIIVTQEAHTIVECCILKVDVNGLCMSNVQNTIGLGREAGPYLSGIDNIVPSVFDLCCLGEEC